VVELGGIARPTQNSSHRLGPHIESKHRGVRYARLFAKIEVHDTGNGTFFLRRTRLRCTVTLEAHVKTTMQTVGERIRKRRLELGWTQDALAEKAGISKSFLSDLENGKRNVGADKLQDIGRVLSLSLDYLMDGQKAETIKSDVQIPNSLADFAARAGLSFKQAITLLDMQNQIIAHRSTTRKDSLEKVDWQKFYEAVKEFLT
jgi:transcriptional regulator with XRE-family HTH domain